MPRRHLRYGGTPESVLADYVAQNADEWATAWLERVCGDSSMGRYSTWEDKDELKRDTTALYHYLALWLKTGEWDPRTESHYQRVGRDRHDAGFPLSQVIRAILLAKRKLWDGLIDNQPLSTNLEREAAKTISRFYDRAIYHTILGYEAAH